MSNLDSHGGQAHPEHPPALLSAAVNPPPHPVAALAPPPLSITTDGWIEGPGTRLSPKDIVFGNGWHFGHPIGILNHFTAGCSDPHDTLVSRRVSAHGCTLSDGSLVQYVSFRNLSFHAYDQAYYTIGWENAALPGICDFDTYVLSRLAQLNAAIIAWTKRTYGFDIPAVRSPGWHYEPGIKCHADGLEPGSPWDPKRHWDCPWKATGDPVAQWVSSGEVAALDRSPWTADEFIQAIQGGDDVALTDAQAAGLDWLASNKDRLETAIEVAEGLTLAADPNAKSAGKNAPAGKQAGFRAGRELKVQNQGGHGA